MSQMLFEFVVEHVAASRPALEPRVQQELIEQMAEAILAVAGAEGGRRDERHGHQS